MSEKIRNNKVMPCNCVVKGQDAMYGAFNRLHNKIGKPEKHSQNHWRCTGCKREKP